MNYKIGKLDKANLRAANADTNVSINSNVWRNFCTSVGIVQRGASSKTPTQRLNKEPTMTSTTTTSLGKTSPRKQQQLLQQQRINEAVATLYPINVPVPSRLGSNTLSRYYEQNKRDLFATDKNFAIARERVERDDARMRLLRLKSEMRNPPLDWNGITLYDIYYWSHCDVTSL